VPKSSGGKKSRLTLNHPHMLSLLVVGLKTFFLILHWNFDNIFMNYVWNWTHIPFHPKLTFILIWECTFKTISFFYAEILPLRKSEIS
jgi:hypothetical protein